jgi:hypothetical protein
MLTEMDCSRVKQDLSVVVPSCCPPDECVGVLMGLLCQSNLPAEVILVRVGVRLGVESSRWGVWSEDFAQMGVTLKVVENKSMLLPGAARNFGLQHATKLWIAFIDVETIPYENWLESQAQRIMASGALGVFGSTIYVANSVKQALVRDAIYGRRPIRTLPGSVLRRDLFDFVGRFIPTVRAAEDTEWMIRAKAMGVHIEESSSEALISYQGLSKLGFRGLAKKWRRNYLSSRQLQHLKVQTAIVWLLGYFVLSLIAFNWNAILAGWQVDSPFYIDHVTKIVSLTPIGVYSVFRGCYLPYKRGLPLLDILPFRFLLLAAVGALLDAVKVTTIFFPRTSRTPKLEKQPPAPE